MAHTGRIRGSFVKLNHAPLSTLITVRAALFVICIFLCIIRTDGQDCEYKVCMCRGDQIMCQYRDLTSLPPLDNEWAADKHLMLDENQITAIPAESLPSNLTEISIMNNPVTTIDEAAFNGSATTLEKLSFSNARFTRISDAFCHLNVLKSLNIYNTNIQDWNLNAMKNIGKSLETVFFQNVGLRGWPSWMHYFTKLKELSLVGCSVDSFPDDAFAAMTDSLTSLTITMCNLIEISKAFANLNNLEHMYVQSNNISKLSWLPRSNILMELSLNDNNISDESELSNSLRVVEGSLSVVSLAQNKLSTIPDLSGMTKLRSLDFSNNQISRPASGSLPPSLYHLDMRYNSLPSIPYVYFNLPIVKDMLLSSNVVSGIQGTLIPYWTLEVDLENNLITELTDTSFPENSSMTSLNLKDNPIVTISVFAFKNLSRLTKLNMQNSRLTRLPLALASLTSLNFLDVSNSRDLVCTCMEKSLQPLCQKLMNNVLGNCGVTSVYNFFNHFISGCPSF